ncbi:MAG TPA: VanZ family protein [Solimonas sp.]
MSSFAAWRRALVPLAVTIYAVMIALGSLWVRLPDPLRDTNDKILHVLAYGGLSVLLFLGLRLPVLRRSLVIVSAIAVMGAIDEYIQSFFPHRHSDVMDWCADVGAAIAVCATFATLRALWRAWRAH